MSAWDNVHGFERVSLCDWSGMSTSVIFLGDCNMRCPTCHNFSLAWDKASLPVIPREDIERYLIDRKRWIDGVVITGGEASITPGLETLIRDLIALGMQIKVDTNGMRPDVVQMLLEKNLVDLFAVDVKGPFALYPRLSGGTTSAEEAERNLNSIFALARQYSDKFYFRLTHVPLLSDDDVEVARSYLPEGFSLTIQEYIPPRRVHAQADSEAGRVPGDVVSGADIHSHS